MMPCLLLATCCYVFMAYVFVEVTTFILVQSWFIILFCALRLVKCMLPCKHGKIGKMVKL